MNRRRYLATAGAIGASLGLAGCLGSDDAADATTTDDETNGTDETGGVQVDDRWQGTRWLPAPAVLDVDPYRVYSIRPGELAANAEYLAGETPAIDLIDELSLELSIELPPADSIDQLTVVRHGSPLSPSAPSWMVVDGAFDRSAIEFELETDEYDRRVRAGYTVFDGADETYAIGDDAIVSGRGSDVTAIVEAVVDASEGEATRYTDEDDAVGRLAETLPGGTFVTAGRADTDGESSGDIVADGTVQRIDGAETTIEFVLVFASEAMVAGPITADLAEQFETQEELTETTYETDGAVVRVRGTKPTEQVEL